jgi:nitrate reductase NapD
LPNDTVIFRTAARAVLTQVNSCGGPIFAPDMIQLKSPGGRVRKIPGIAAEEEAGLVSRRQLLGGKAAEVASVIVSALPGRRDLLKAQMLALPGVEIHAETPDGRFIVTVESTGQASAGDTLLALHRLDAVLAAALVSHYET